MFTARVDAASAIAKLNALQSKLRAGVREAVEEDAARLLALVCDKLSGEVLNARTGNLLRSIRSETSDNGARVFSDGSVPYARIQEYGGRVSVPAIEPVNAKALAFAYDGRMVFAKRTAAHAVDIPERSYLRASLDEFAPAFLDDIRKLVAEALA